jgi:hypothetical protein
MFVYEVTVLVAFLLDEQTFCVMRAGGGEPVIRELCPREVA